MEFPEEGVEHLIKEGVHPKTWAEAAKQCQEHLDKAVRYGFNEAHLVPHDVSVFQRGGLTEDKAVAAAVSIRLSMGQA